MNYSTYFYHPAKVIRRKAIERGMDFILFVLPDGNISRIMPTVSQLCADGVKVLAYEPHEAANRPLSKSWLPFTRRQQEKVTALVVASPGYRYP
jgi:hypothetical protein